ncbi:MAG: hypothetical protein ABI577_06930 [bacterium]
MNRNRKLLAAAGIGFFAASLGVGGWAWADESRGEQAHQTVPGLIASIKPQLNDGEKAALADGVLTREEYDAAQGRVVSCLEAAGLTVHREPGRGPGGIDEIWAESPPSAGDLGNVFLDCYQRYQGKLSLIWAEQNRPTADALAQRGAAIDSCLASKGLGFRPLSELWESDHGRDAYFECLSETPTP